MLGFHFVPFSNYASDTVKEHNVQLTVREDE